MLKKTKLLALIFLSLIAPLSFGQSKAPAGTGDVTAPPPIPEEARRHFVMGTTLFGDAKTVDDYSQAENEFKQAVDLAPQWPEARYNLALAREAAGDYSGAIADLKVYLQFKLSDGEARAVQDKIYALEAKRQKKESARAAAMEAQLHAEAVRQSVARREFIKKIEGDWHWGGAWLSIKPLDDGGNLDISLRWSSLDHEKVIDQTVTESTLLVKVIHTRVGNPEALTIFRLALDGQGRLKGTMTDSYTENGKEFRRQLGFDDWRNADEASLDVVFTRQ
jgi:tetratricopeptide (TPR) repeat protein